MNCPSAVFQSAFFSAVVFLVSAAALVGARPAVADEITCGSLQNGGNGPFDYRGANRDSIERAELVHFTPDVEMLRRGSTGTVGSDLSYVLAVSPNHHRALAAMMNYQFKTRSEQPTGARWSVPCYFERAMRFQPDDGAVRTLYGVYLMRLGKPSDAVAQFEKAASLGEDSGNLHYNLGLAYFDVGDYDKSLAEARKAYHMGFDLPGLRDKLTKAGKWPPS
jgi:Tfp pilus assembly protein PilF